MGRRASVLVAYTYIGEVVIHPATGLGSCRFYLRLSDTDHGKSGKSIRVFSGMTTVQFRAQSPRRVAPDSRFDRAGSVTEGTGSRECLPVRVRSSLFRPSVKDTRDRLGRMQSRYLCNVRCAGHSRDEQTEKQADGRTDRMSRPASESPVAVGLIM